MGQPRKSRKKYNTPPHPWNAERIKNENKSTTAMNDFEILKLKNITIPPCVAK